MSAEFRVPSSGFRVDGAKRRDLLVAAGVALGLHALLFMALPVALFLSPAHAGQSPGVTSLEIALSSPAPKRPRPAPVAPDPEPEPALEEPVLLPKPELEPESVSEPEPALTAKREAPAAIPEPAPVSLPAPPPPAPRLPAPPPDPEPGTRNFTRRGGPEPSISSSGARAATWSHHNIRYPETALREGRTGRVGVRVEVLASGRAGEVELVESSGHADLDRAAVNGLKTAWYDPATDGKRVVTAVQLFHANFEIENGRAKVR